jgi:hypothetical protein
MRVGTDQTFMIVTVTALSVMLMAKHSRKIALMECWSFGVLRAKIMHYLL